MIREAKPCDIEAIARLGRESLERNSHQGLRISQPKIDEMARELVTGAQNFAWVAEDDDGVVVGAVCAYVHECMFFERRQASVVMFYTQKPRSGGFLIRRLVKWYKSRPGLKMLVFTLERGADPRIGGLLVKLGLDAEMPNFVGVDL